jgi:hypothetical protein
MTLERYRPRVDRASSFTPKRSIMALAVRWAMMAWEK